MQRMTTQAQFDAHDLSFLRGLERLHTAFSSPATISAVEACMDEMTARLMSQARPSLRSGPDSGPDSGEGEA